MGFRTTISGAGARGSLYELEAGRPGMGTGFVWCVWCVEIPIWSIATISPVSQGGEVTSSPPRRHGAVEEGYLERMQCFAPGNPKFPQFRGWSDPPVQAIESPARPKLIPVSRLAALYPVPPQPPPWTLGSGAARTGRSPVNSPRIDPRTLVLAAAVSSQHLDGEWWEHRRATGTGPEARVPPARG